MSFKFRNDDAPIILKDNDICLALSGGIMAPNSHRCGFHNSTKKYFNIQSGQDLCHRYSFSSMKKFLCYSYNTGKYEILNDLISVMYSCDGNPYPGDYNTALDIINKIRNTANIAERVFYFNELLYVLNNVIINLRPGDARWNRSIRECYDPEEWYCNSRGFVISSSTDVHLIRYLLTIRVDPPTIYFYTAQTKSGDKLLYSSNNIFPNEGITAYGKCDLPIFIRLPDGTEHEIT